MGRLLALIGALIAAGLIAWAGEQTPKPAPASAPATAFSAERAMADIRGFASAPHPVGSAANHAARDYLLRRMTALGLSPQIRPGAGVDQPRGAANVVVGGYVENIVGVLPGRDRSLPAVALMAHYDSVPASSGASDDAAGVASALEIVRAIRARGVPARDVVVLVTDGEEAGLLGADAFFRRDPLARHVGFVFNMEARGSAGRVQMFQTGPSNGDAVRLMAAKARRPVSSSLTIFVYEKMPNDTDFTVSKAAGVPGLNYGFIGRQFDYHSPSSTPATQDPGSLQDMGDQVLPVAIAVAFSPTLPKRTESLVYGQVPGGITLAYPPAVGWAILAAAAGLIAWAVVRARRKEPFAWLDLARGAGAALFALATGAVVLHAARLLTGAATGYLEQRVLLAQAARWEAALFLLGAGVVLLAAAQMSRGKRWAIAALPLVVGVLCVVLDHTDRVGPIEGMSGAVLALAVYGRPASRSGAWTGGLLLGLLLAAVVQAVAPPAAFVFAWPLTLAALAAASTAAAAHRGTAPIVLLALFAAIGLAYAAGFAHTSYLSLDLPELLCLPLLIAVVVVWPLAQTEEGAPPARLLGPVLMLLGLAVTLAVRFNHPYDARHPQASQVAYRIDQDKRLAWRVSSTPERPAWAEQVLKADGGTIGKIPGWRARKVDAAPAPYVETAPPQIGFAKQGDGQVRMHIVPPPGARVVDLKLNADTAATLTELGGVPVRLPMKPGGDTLVSWAAAQPGFDVVIRPGGPGKLTTLYRATIEAWPAQAKPLPPRPRGVMPFDLSDSTVIEGSRRFSW
ncbi:MAG: M20/M25/M40 family metallo-hydrolase [Phenylobacterium sp.]